MKPVASALAVVALFFAVAGCGDTGATKTELHNAYERGYSAGEATGRTKAEAGASEEWGSGYDAGYAAGEEEAYELEEELDEEELRDEFGIENGQYEEGAIGGEPINPYPLKQNGEPSYEFEPEDIERAEEGAEDEALREYCEEAVSEAQEVGCLSHVEPWEVP
jgi:hypothetical protein